MHGWKFIHDQEQWSQREIFDDNECERKNNTSFFQLSLLRPIHTNRKQRFSLMFVAYFIIFFYCS